MTSASYIMRISMIICSTLCTAQPLANINGAYYCSDIRIRALMSVGLGIARDAASYALATQLMSVHEVQNDTTNTPVYVSDICNGTSPGFLAMLGVYMSGLYYTYTRFYPNTDILLGYITGLICDMATSCFASHSPSIPESHYVCHTIAENAGLYHMARSIITPRRLTLSLAGFTWAHLCGCRQQEYQALHQLVQHGYLEQAQRQLNNTNPLARHSTLLHIAIETQAHNTARTLLDEGTDPRVLDRVYECDAYTTICRYNNFNIITSLTYEQMCDLLTVSLREHHIPIATHTLNNLSDAVLCNRYSLDTLREHILRCEEIKTSKIPSIQASQYIISQRLRHIADQKQITQDVTGRTQKKHVDPTPHHAFVNTYPHISYARFKRNLITREIKQQAIDTQLTYSHSSTHPKRDQNAHMRCP